MMNVYLAGHKTSVKDTEKYAIFIRRSGGVAYVEQDGERVLLITNDVIWGIGYTYLGER